MARRMEAGTLTAAILGATLIGGLALPAQAQDSLDLSALPAQKRDSLDLSATAAFTTDYVFRGISQTQDGPAVQASLDASYGIFYLGAWGSNIDFGGNDFGADIANIEIDYYGGIAPMWQGFSFDIGGIYYTYPGAYDPGGDFNYFELKTGATYTFFDALTLGVTNYWSPEYSGEIGNADALELAGEYAFTNKWWIFTPSVSALVGWQWFDDTASVDYTYWNVGLTLGFLDNWSADVRYWDSDITDASCINGPNSCDERVVGTISASF